MEVFEYFPGANTPKGFYSYYDCILKSSEANKIIILKGGPGTGKSTFMKNIAAHLLSLGYDTELLHCSSDPASLDGVCAREIGFLILDGTSPHIVDPKCPGAVDEIINLGECWNAEKIAKNKDSIIEINNRISSYFMRAYRFFKAAKSVQEQIDSDFEQITDMSMVRYELERLKRELSLGEIGTNAGNERSAFISAVTPDGRVNFADSFVRSARIVYKIKSKSRSSSKYFMKRLADMLKNSGINICAFYCPMSPDKNIEHIYADGMLFTVENDYHAVSCSDNVIIVNLDDYLNSDKISELTLECIQQYDSCLDSAENMIKSAKKLHDKLEEYYVPYMDFSRADELCDSVIRSLK